MNAALPGRSEELGALAELLSGAEFQPASEQYINELLLDVRPWRKLGREELLEKLAGHPLAALSVWELSLAYGHLRKHGISETDFVRAFSDPDILQRMVYLGLREPPESLPELPRAFVIARRDEWDALLFVQCTLRWAERFGGWSGKDLAELRRLVVQFPFAVAVLDPPETRTEAHLRQVLDFLGVRVLQPEPAVVQQHFEPWLRENLGLKPLKRRGTQQRLEFREAGGTPISIFAVRAIGGVDGYDVRGAVGPDLGLIIDIGDREVSVAATAYLEEHVIRVINDSPDLSAERIENSLRLRWYDNRLEAIDLGRIIHSALKEQFILGTVSVNLIFDPLRINSLRPNILSYKEDRSQQLKRRSEEAAPFVVCTACRAYAPHAFCIASSERSPCCGRSYDELATLAQLTRQPEQWVVDKGICQDRARGIYFGAEKAAAICSEGQVHSLALHSLRDRPHPTTAIPQCIVYSIEELDVLCVVGRGYLGRTPDGKTFDTLLARCAGRQQPGLLGVSEDYLSSPRFLTLEGGLAAVAWMDSGLKSRLKISGGQIATEQTCLNMGALREHLATWRR